MASLLSPAGKAQNAITNARRHVTSYLDSEYTTDPVERERIFGLLLAKRDQIVEEGREDTFPSAGSVYSASGKRWCVGAFEIAFCVGHAC